MTEVLIDDFDDFDDDDDEKEDDGDLVVSLNRGPQYRPQHILILITGTPTWYP